MEGQERFAISRGNMTESPPARLRLGMVGGGRGAFIGEAHRVAARLDDRYELVAGALSAAEAGGPFALKETYEFLDEEWENTQELLNSREAFSSFLESW